MSRSRCAVTGLTWVAAHLVIGTRGDHVSKVQTALFLVDDLQVDPAELRAAAKGRLAIPA